MFKQSLPSIEQFAAYLDGKVGCRELADIVDSADTVKKIPLESCNIIAYAGHNAQACNCYSSFHNFILETPKVRIFPYICKL